MHLPAERTERLLEVIVSKMYGVGNRGEGEIENRGELGRKGKLELEGAAC